ncbi:MAG TPA: hypothetical protein VL001_06420 [Candidimonas sp.]|nr:hypothetical protein [Candidimonas sp.]
MSLIVAARFETFDAAEKAASALARAGVAPDALHTFFVNPAGAHDRYPVGGDRAADPQAKGAPFGAVGGAAAVGIVGALVGGVIAFTFADSMLPIVAGAGVGAYIGSLAGAVHSLGGKKQIDHSRHRQGPRVPAEEIQEGQGHPSGVMLAVHTSPEHEKHIAAILRDNGGTAVERAQGRWRDGKWEDFDPLADPELEQRF